MRDLQEVGGRPSGSSQLNETAFARALLLRRGRSRKGCLLRAPEGGFDLWNAVPVAVGAADPVDVVGAFCAGEGRVHLFDVDAAVGHLGMAGFAGGCRILVVAGVAGEATDALVDASGGAIIARADLRTVMISCSHGVCLGLARRVALIAERLALVGTAFHRARTV